MSGSRKSLSVIQAVSSERMSLAADPVKSALGDENAYPVAHRVKTVSNHPVVIYEDQQVVTKCCEKRDMDTQTETSCCNCCGDSLPDPCRDSANSARLDEDLITRDEVPAEYWQILAEQRREALEDSLNENKNIHAENEKLVSEIKELRLEIDQLQEDNAQLLQLAGEAEYFATMLKKLTNETDKPNDGEPATVPMKDENDSKTEL